MQKQKVGFPFPQPVVFNVEATGGVRVVGQIDGISFRYARGGLFSPPRVVDGFVDLGKLQQAIFRWDAEVGEEEEDISLCNLKGEIVVWGRECYTVGEMAEEARGRRCCVFPLWVWRWVVILLPPRECKVVINEGAVCFWAEEAENSWYLYLWRHRPPRLLEEYEE